MRIILFCVAFIIAVISISKIRDGSNKSEMDDPLRPQFHFTADSNFLSDPNGLLYLAERLYTADDLYQLIKH